MNGSRKPAAFKLDDSGENAKSKSTVTASGSRAPRAVSGGANVELSLPSEDPFESEIAELDLPAVSSPRPKRFRFGVIFASAAGLFISLALGLWAESLITDFFARSEWLGWLASALAGIAALALAGVLIREVLALRRLRSVENLQRRAAEVSTSGDIGAARKFISDLEAFASTNPATAHGREALSKLEGEIIDAADLVAIAERELFSHLDLQAREMVLQAARRVSVVTAVSPRALVDVGYVLFESGRLVRRLSVHYGGRPGLLGFLKLTRDVAAHLAVTGSIAVGDSLVQQIVGHGIAAKLSARLGEGVVNGLMTARIGIAAMETARPLPFKAIKRPGIGEFFTALAGSVAGRKPAG